MKRFKKILTFLLIVTMLFNLTGSMTVRAASEVELSTVMTKEEYTDSATGTTMPYRLFVPEDYDASKTYPVVVFLHGAGERGNDNEAQLVNAIQPLFDSHEQMQEAIVIAPQCPSGKRWVETDWAQGNYDSSAIQEEQLATVMKILGSVQEQYSTDTDRIYAVGISMGGFGTWNLLMNHSDVFAAGIPICGGADPNKADILKDIPIWTFHGTADPTVPYAGTAEMYNAVVAAGGNSMKFITYTGGVHNIWNKAAETEGLIDWLFAQKLSERTEAVKTDAVNLFDKTDSDNWLNALSYNGEKLENTTSYANVFTTHKINVENGDTIYWGGFAQENYVMELYAEDDTFIKQVSFAEVQKMATGSTIQGVGSSNPEEYRYAYRISNASAGYVRILGNISTMDSFAVYLNLEEVPEGWPSMEPVKESVLNGKSILFVGDSITAATRDDYNLSGWAGRIGSDYGMDSTNGGVSGASLSTVRGTKRILVQMMDRAENDYDYLIFHGGVNDAMDSAEVGEISDSFDVDDFDVTTYAGALEELFYQAYMNFEGTAFGYIINYATPNSTWGGRTTDMSEYFEVGKQICEKWDVPYIDLYSGTVEVDGETLSYSYDILDVNTGDNMYNGDAGEVHIGGSGYDLISPYIGAWVETLQESTMPEGLVAHINDYKGKIEKVFGKLENYPFSIYTDESLEILEIAAANSETVIADEKATDEEVKAAYELLVKAVDVLETRENLALEKPVSASHNNSNAYKITDGSLSTYWEGRENGDIAIEESSFVIDLQGIYDLDAITAVPYYAADSRIYHYDISVSTDNENWTKVAEQRSTEYTKEAGATFEFEETVEARYIKVEGVDVTVVERPTIINFHVVEMRAYGTLLEEVEIEETKTLENLALYGNVTANAGTTNISYITDGNSTGNYYTNSTVEITDSYVVVELPGKSLVDNVRVVTYSKNTSKWYNWEVFVSEDNSSWTSVGTYEEAVNPGYDGITVTLEEPVAANYVKIQGLATNNTNLHLVEVEVYGTLDNIVKGKPVTANKTNGSYVPENAVDGSFGSYWDAAATEWATATEEDYPYLVVDLEGTYQLDNINVMNYRNSSRYYQYQIYTSMDGEEYTLLAQKDDEVTSLYSINYAAEGTIARYIKLLGTLNSANSGYHVVELKATGTFLPEADADYSAVEAAIAKIPEDLSIYTAASVVDLKIAVQNVTEGLTESRQAEVDAMAAAIEAAIEALEEKPTEPEVTEISLDAIVKTTAGNEEITYGNDTEGAAALATDGNEGTIWHTDWFPEDGNTYDDHWLQLELDGFYEVNGFRYLPRQNSSQNGDIIKYQILVSLDGENWEVAGEGTWEAGKEWKEVTFEAKVAKYVRLQAVETLGDQQTKHFTAASEVRVLGEATDYVYKGALEALIENTKAMDVSGYTEESVLQLLITLAQVQEVADKEDATQEEVDAAIETLQSSIDSLEEAAVIVPVDKTALNAAINEALALDPYEYVDFTVVREALWNAQDVAEDADATQTEVDAAKETLENAMAALEKTPATVPVDKSVLELMLSDIKEKDLTPYTEESANLLRQMIAEAEAVVANPNATQEDVTNAKLNLVNATAALQEKPVEPPVVVEEDEVVRISGKTRYETGYKVADALKEELGVEKFDAVVVATGKNFADALAGSYLAVEKNAPILLTNGKEDNIAALHEYIAENVAAGGKVYILGGEGAVPAEVAAIDGYDVVRLSGKSRYETNLAILAEAGIAGDEIIVATGKTFADSLSASAAKLPILLVKPGAALSEEAKAIAEGMNKFYIIGGEGAVSADIEAELAVYGEVVRVSGKTRYETSVAVANTFFTDVEEAVVANGKNFPDGLCGGPLAAAMNAPLILTADGKTDAASGYMAENAVASGYVLGGTGALADESVVDVFAVESAEEIILR